MRWEPCQPKETMNLIEISIFHLFTVIEESVSNWKTSGADSFGIHELQHHKNVHVQSLQDSNQILQQLQLLPIVIYVVTIVATYRVPKIWTKQFPSWLRSNFLKNFMVLSAKSKFRIETNTQS